MGVYFQLMHPLYTGRPSAMFAPTYPRLPTITSPETIMQALKALKPNVAFVVPSILEAWIHDHEAVEFLKTIDVIVSNPSPLCCCPLEAHIIFSVTAAVRFRQLWATIL
jgi:hypothetical protein